MPQYEMMSKKRYVFYMKLRYKKDAERASDDWEYLYRFSDEDKMTFNSRGELEIQVRVAE